MFQKTSFSSLSIPTIFTIPGEGDLEDGVFDSDWRIRHASVQLMGQLIEQMLRSHRIPIQNAELMYCEQIPKEPV